jgi:hypothetical protein
LRFGSEIEQAFVEALYAAFDEDAEPTDLAVATVLTPLAPATTSSASPSVHRKARASTFKMST